MCVCVCVCMGFPGGSSGKEQGYQCWRHKRFWFNPWVKKIFWRRAWQPTPVLLPTEFHGQRSLTAYGPWVLKESNMTEVTWHAHVCMYLCVCVCVCIYIYTHKQKISHKKNEILLFTATCMDLENILLSEMSKTNTYSITYIWNL